MARTGTEQEKSLEEAQIDWHRQEIDATDEAIVKALCKRDVHCLEIGRLKEEYGLPTKDNGREQRVVEKVRVLAIKCGGDPDYVEEMYREIMRCSRERQDALRMKG